MTKYYLAVDIGASSGRLLSAPSRQQKSRFCGSIHA